MPVLPAGPRRVAAPGPARLGGRVERRLRPVRVALAVRGLDRAAPPRGRLRTGRRPPDVAATAEALRQVLARLAASLDGPPYNLVLHTAPLREQVDATYHWHWEIHPRLREIAGPGAGNRTAGQPGLARGRGRGAAGPGRARRGRLGLSAPRPGASTGVTPGKVRRHWADERAPPSAAFRPPTRSEYLWSPIRSR